MLYIFLFIITISIVGILVKLSHIHDCLNGIRRKQ